MSEFELSAFPLLSMAFSFSLLRTSDLKNELVFRTIFQALK
jgi:hypothetical protein